MAADLQQASLATGPSPADVLDLPTIDFSLFRGPAATPESRRAVADAVHRAATDHGFLYLLNTGLPRDEIDRLFGVGKGFFADVPAEVRRDPRWAFGGDYAGYRDTSFPVSTPNGLPADPKVEISMMRRQGTRLPPSFNGDRGFFGYDFLNVPGKWGPGEFDKTRVWPDYINERGQEVRQFTRRMYDLGLDLLRCFAMMLELDDPEWFVKKHRYDVPSRDSFRWIKYAPVPDHVKPGPEGIIRTAAHSDYGSLTMLIQHGEPGLQLNLRGRWVDIKPNPDAVLVNIADCLQFWTEGYLASTLHRVVSDTPEQQRQTRYVMAYFMRPEHDCLLVDVPSPVLAKWKERQGLGARPPEEIVTAGEWTNRKLKAVYDVDQKAKM